MFGIGATRVLCQLNYGGIVFNFDKSSTWTVITITLHTAFADFFLFLLLELILLAAICSNAPQEGSGHPGRNQVVFSGWDTFIALLSGVLFCAYLLASFFYMIVSCYLF